MIGSLKKTVFMVTDQMAADYVFAKQKIFIVLNWFKATWNLIM